MVLVAVVYASAEAAACPFCGTETSKLVRASIFNDQFWINAAATLAPWPLLLVATAFMHFRMDRH
jgi:hypothetical protein